MATFIPLLAGNIWCKRIIFTDVTSGTTARTPLDFLIFSQDNISKDISYRRILACVCTVESVYYFS